jgi:hypothetical protein
MASTIAVLLGERFETWSNPSGAIALPMTNDYHPTYTKATNY